MTSPERARGLCGQVVPQGPAHAGVDAVVVDDDHDDGQPVPGEVGPRSEEDSRGERTEGLLDTSEVDSKLKGNL